MVAIRSVGTPLAAIRSGHVRTEDDHPIGLASAGVADPAEGADHGVARIHPAEGDAGVGVEVHAPGEVPRPLEALQDRPDKADDRGRRQGDDRIEPGEQESGDERPDVEAEIVGHPPESALAPQRGGLDPVDLHAPVRLARRRTFRAGLIAAAAAKDVDLMPPGGEVLGEVGQVLRRGGVVGPVVLVDEQEPTRRRRPRIGPSGVGGGLGHHLASAWALLARYQATVLARPSLSFVGGVQPRIACIRVVSRTLNPAPSGLSVSQVILP